MEAFKRFLKKRGLTERELAFLLGESLSTICRKINGDGEFNLAQLMRIKQLLGMSSREFVRVFFD